MTSYFTKKTSMSKYRRWNFDSNDKGIIVCKGEHNKGHHCEDHEELLSTPELLAILKDMQLLLLK